MEFFKKQPISLQKFRSLFSTHCIILIFVYIYGKFISEQDTFSVPSPYQGCTFLAPWLHQACVILA